MKETFTVTEITESVAEGARVKMESESRAFYRDGEQLKPLRLPSGNLYISFPENPNIVLGDKFVLQRMA